MRHLGLIGLADEELGGRGGLSAPSRPDDRGVWTSGPAASLVNTRLSI
jgi:hypothetical protein